MRRVAAVLKAVPTVEFLKECSRCRRECPTSTGYTKNTQTKDGFHSWCRECHNKDKRDRWARNKSKIIAANHGLTEQQYVDLLNRYNNRCAICGSDGPQLSVDHNHTTGEVRALLCSKCNCAIGLVGESIQRLEQIIAYLITHNGATT